jgi:dipeptidyl aminopeptidase/acylaminoacyl peptidase
VREISYSSEGLTITGILALPESNGPVPLIVINHGGFDPAKTLQPLVELFAKMGYVAIASDYRGVAGSQGKRELAKGEIADVLNAIQYARTLPQVDPKRTVMLGFSHGGALAIHAAARDATIGGIVTVGAPVEMADCYRHWVETVSQHPELKPLVGLTMIVGGTPEQMPAAWKERSALYAADKVKCPVLLIQGAKDTAVPVEQAQRMEQALKKAQTPVELVVDAEAGHVLDKAAYDRLGKRMIGFLNSHAGLPVAP